MATKPHQTSQRWVASHGLPGPRRVREGRAGRMRVLAGWSFHCFNWFTRSGAFHVAILFRRAPSNNFELGSLQWCLLPIICWLAVGWLAREMFDS